MWGCPEYQQSYNSPLVCCHEFFVRIKYFDLTLIRCCLVAVMAPQVKQRKIAILGARSVGMAWDNLRRSRLIETRKVFIDCQICWRTFRRILLSYNREYIQSWNHIQRRDIFDDIDRLARSRWVQHTQFETLHWNTWLHVGLLSCLSAILWYDQSHTRQDSEQSGKQKSLRTGRSDTLRVLKTFLSWS